MQYKTYMIRFQNIYALHSYYNCLFPGSHYCQLPDRHTSVVTGYMSRCEQQDTQLRQTCAATVPSDVYSENSHLRSRLCPFRSASCTVSPSLPKAMPTYYENGQITRFTGTPAARSSNIPSNTGHMEIDSFSIKTE